MENEFCLHMVNIFFVYLSNHHELKFILFDAYIYQVHSIGFDDTIFWISRVVLWWFVHYLGVFYVKWKPVNKKLNYRYICDLYEVKTAILQQ